MLDGLPLKVKKINPGKITYIMQLARPIWPQEIVANCGS